MANNMKDIDIQQLSDFYNEMEKNRINKVGYILLPSLEGFEVFEISEVNLKKYLTLEGMLNRKNKDPQKQNPTS